MSNKLVIFDCDGVLINSEIIANRLHAAILTRYGYPMTAEESVKKFTGLSEKAASQLVLEESGIAIPEDYWSAEEHSIYATYKTELIPLVQPILESLSARKIARCVASNSSKNYLLHSLGLTKQRTYFQDEAIFSAEQVLHGKPEPDLFLFAAHQMRYQPKDCIVIEDSVTGIKAALKANMPVIAFLGACHTQSDWYHENIKRLSVPIAHNCDELLETLEKAL